MNQYIEEVDAETSAYAAWVVVRAMKLAERGYLIGNIQATDAAYRKCEKLRSLGFIPRRDKLISFLETLDDIPKDIVPVYVELFLNEEIQ